jgi:hypothetical protein
MLMWHSSLEHWRPRQLDDILHDGHMESGLLAWRMIHLGGGVGHLGGGH